MTQNNELTKIKLKIKALTNKTVAAGCTEHEAMQAMEVVGRLLSQYNLTMEEVDVREQVCKTIHIQSGGVRRGAIDNCIISLANLVGAKTWFARSRFGSSYAFFGQENDLELIQYLFDVIKSAIDAETEKFKTTEYYRVSRQKKSATVSFGRGMASRISDRLEDMKRENDEALRRKEEEMFVAEEGSELQAEAEKNNRTKGTALIVLKGKLIEQEFAKEGLKLRKKSYSYHRSNDGGARSYGRAAGNKVNLSRPIGGGQKNGGLLS